MRLRHMNDRRYDLPTQIDSLSRDTTEMLLATLNSVDPTGNTGEELYLGVLNCIELDWNDKTHNVCTEFIQSSEWSTPDCTRLTITVTNVIDPIDENYTRIETVLTVSVLLGHLHTEYHTRYIPIDWSLTVMKTPGNDFPTMFNQFQITGGVAIATMRSLAIQMGISLAAQNRRLDSDTINKMRTYGVSESQEMSFLRLGLDRIIDLIKNAMPSDTTN